MAAKGVALNGSRRCYADGTVKTHGAGKINSSNATNSYTGLKNSTPHNHCQGPELLLMTKYKLPFLCKVETYDAC